MVSFLHHYVPELITCPENGHALFVNGIQRLELLQENGPGVGAVIGRGPARRELVILRNVLLEFVRSPAGFVIEGDPLTHGGQFGGFVVLREKARVQDRVVRTGEHVVGAPARLGRGPVGDFFGVKSLFIEVTSSARLAGIATDYGCGRFGVAGLLARNLAHVAVLAGLAPMRRGRVLERAEGLLQPEAIHQRHIVARTAEAGRAQLFGFLDVAVDLESRFVGVGDQRGILIRLRKDPLEFGIAGRPEGGFGDVRRDQGETAAHLAISTFQAMADDAGDALARGGMAVHVAHEDRLAQVHAHLGVAADAEVAVRAAGQLGGGCRHRVEHRAKLAVSMGRDRPLAIMVRMAGAAGGRRRILALAEKPCVLGFGIRWVRLGFGVLGHGRRLFGSGQQDWTFFGSRGRRLSQG